MKKILCFGLISLLLLSGCGKTDKLKEGSYEGTAIDTYGGQENTASAKVIIDGNGKITGVSLDITYTTKDGVKTTKKALGNQYGMKKGNSSYGKADLEWNEQIENLEKAVVEKQGIDFIKLDDNGKTDTVSGCTIQVESLYNALDSAIKKAK